jgi:ABC-2 type transport system permease protein
MLALLYAFPIVAALVTDPRWQHRLARFGPMEAGLSVQNTIRLDDLAIAPWPGLGVLATYAGIALVSGLALFQLRDA